MEEQNIKIFNDDNNVVQLPGNGNKVDANYDELVSNDIKKAICGNTVKSLMLSEDLELMYPNYTIDFSEVDEVNKIQLLAINSMLDEYGDTAIYVYRNGSMQRLGMARDDIISRIIATSLNNVFQGKCKVYKDFNPNEPVKIVKGKDIRNMRLSI